jgi:hypothetical protein
MLRRWSIEKLYDSSFPTYSGYGKYYSSFPLEYFASATVIWAREKSGAVQQRIMHRVGLTLFFIYLIGHVDVMTTPVIEIR